MGLFGTSTTENSFISQLKLQAEKAIACVVFLEQNMSKADADAIKKSKQLIDEIIDIKMILMDDLHNTFITPIDREDIYNISVCLFEMAKYAETTLEEMYFLDVKPDHFILEMVEKVKAETTELFNAISRLTKNPRIAYEHVLNVSKLETKVDRLYREAIKFLFEDKEKLVDELQRVLKLREVYRHISNMSDRADAVADALGIAIIKLS